jgi:hypothetical protein
MCGPLPLATGCRAPGRSALRIKNRGGDRNRLEWEWARGDAPAAEFGDPRSATAYAFCLYDSSGLVAQQVFSAQVPPGGACRERDCWKVTPSGFRFDDRDGLNDGTRRISLRGDIPGRGHVTFEARGDNLVLPAPAAPSRMFNQDELVTAQLINSDGACWQTAFAPADAKTNSATFFRARGSAPFPTQPAPPPAP